MSARHLGELMSRRLECDRDRSRLGCAWNPVLNGKAGVSAAAGAGGHRLGHGRTLDADAGELASTSWDRGDRRR